MFVELFLSLVVALLVYDYLKRRKRNQFFDKNNFKGPRVLPLIGGAHHLINKKPEDIFPLLSGWTAKFGKTWRMWLLHECALLTSDAKLMESILSSQQVIAKNKLYDLLFNWLGSGLLLSTGKKWHARRKIITPTFHFKILEQFVEIFDQQSEVLVQKLHPKADGKTTVNIFPVVCLTALDIIAETAMGVKVNAQLDPDFKYVKAVTAASEILTIRFLKPNQRFDSIMRWTAPLEFKRLQKSIDIMHSFTDEVIEQRRHALENEIADGTYKEMSTEDDFGKKRRLALLDVLLQSSLSGSPLSKSDIREEVDTFMFEGHDTTTSGISHTLYLLSRHPEVQNKLFEEIRDVLGDDKTKNVTMRELQDLKYLECVIKESLRLYPPVPIIGRYVSEDINLNGTHIAANTNVFVLIYHALRDSEYFNDPEAFVPERFLSEEKTKINPFAYVPFSAGPRNCIGQKFAILEMKSTISKILRHFELLPLGEPVRPVMNIILRSINGINLGLKSRQY